MALLGNVGDSGSYVSTDDTPKSDAIFDAIFVSFDAPYIEQALANVTKASVKATPYRAGLTDTAMSIKWAGSALAGAC